MAYVGRQPLAGEVIVLDDIQSQFNGSLTTFALTRNINGTTAAFFPAVSEQIQVVLGGVVQEPDRTGTRGFNINGSNINFVTPPPTGTDCFIISYGNITDLVDYKSLVAPFKSIPFTESIYYTNPDDLNLTTGIITSTNSDDMFSFTESTIIGNNETVEIADGETYTINILPGAASASSGSGSSYVLPTATSSVLGGVKVGGTGISISSGVISVNQGAIDYNNLQNLPDLTPNNNLTVTGASAGDLLVHNGTKFATNNGVNITSTALHMDGNREFAIFEQDTSAAFTNSSKISMDFSSNIARIRSSWNGSGTNAVGRPLAFYIGNVKVMDLGIGSTSDPELDLELGLHWCKRPTGQTASIEGRLGYGTNHVYVGGTTSTTALKIYAGGSNRIDIDTSGNTTPAVDNTQDLGSSAKRWANVFSADLQLSNEGSANDVDGTWGNYTIQEGQDDLFLLNRRNGKKYKFMLQEVS